MRTNLNKLPRVRYCSFQQKMGSLVVIPLATSHRSRSCRSEILRQRSSLELPEPRWSSANRDDGNVGEGRLNRKHNDLNGTSAADLTPASSHLFAMRGFSAIRDLIARVSRLTHRCSVVSLASLGRGCGHLIDDDVMMRRRDASMIVSITLVPRT